VGLMEALSGMYKKLFANNKVHLMKKLLHRLCSPSMLT